MARILIQRVTLVGQIGDQQTGPASVVVVRKIHTHAGIGSSVTVDGNLREQPGLLKSAVALVVIKKFHHGVVGNEDVHFPVAVVISDGDAEAFPWLGDAGFLADLSEVAISVIMKNERRNRLEDVGVAVGTVALFLLPARNVVVVPF